MKTFLATLALVVAVVASPVLVSAQEFGTDPDASVRFELNRDHQWKTGG